MAKDFDEVRVVFDRCLTPSLGRRQGGNETREKQHTIISETTHSSITFISNISYLLQEQKVILQSTLPKKVCVIPEALQIDLKKMHGDISQWTSWRM